MLIRQGIKHYLNWEEEGFQIVGEASNGKEALELIEATNPHIILTDIVMPIMDGDELTRIVKSKYPHIEIIILSSFSDFEYVRSTFQSGVVDYILKPKIDGPELLKVLRKAANRIPAFQFIGSQSDFNLSLEHTIDKLISGYEINYDSEVISKILPYKYYYLMGIDLQKYSTKRKEEFKTYLKEKFEESFPSQLVHHTFQQDQNVIVFLLNVQQEYTVELSRFATLLVEAESKARFVLSEYFLDFSKLGMIYKVNIIKLLQYQFYFPNQIVLVQQDLPAQPPECEAFNLDWFTEEFTHERFDTAFVYLKKHVNKLSTCYTMDIFEYKSFFGNIIFNIAVLLGNMEYNVKNLESAKYLCFTAINESSTAGEVVEQLNMFITEANKAIADKRNKLGNSNMKKLLEYVEEHYNEPLSLSSVAKHFHFNPSYLSSYFTAHNNEGFNEYLNKIRIEEAAKLLLKDTATISEISGMVGYSDHSYFCKVFKKMKGVSPSKYRRKYS
ncbi:response regulator transcription factor [Fredinandcohnia sp. SECRCQ15]|uniref:Response regulator transcription factor n=2 Tax=Fredinandcohnia quinoae TaxID=2918902 RepID=A0AAW5DXG8_9BACI|nr:response regulator transcription factor [Fredinandcohnia sp. SECRCQ15]